MSWMAISSMIASRTSNGRWSKDLLLDPCPPLLCTEEARMVSIIGFSRRRLPRVLVGIFGLGSSLSCRYVEEKHN